MGIVNSNIFFFFVFWSVKLMAYYSQPKESFNIKTDQYIYLASFVGLQATARHVNAINALLCWLKIIIYLSIVPNFALINGTLARAADGIKSFAFIFAIIMYAFSCAFMMAFGTNSESYQNLVTTGKTLMETLLGDFDFAELDEAHWLMGPLLFISF